MAQSQQPSVLTSAGWTVSAFPRPSDAGAGDKQFCGAKAGFGPALSFTFARDSAGGQSLALELGQAGLTAGATLSLTLAAAAQSYTLSALAATDRIALLTVPKGGDVEAALRQEGIARFRLTPTQDFFLSLSGFNAAVNALDTCLSAARDNKDFAPVKVAAPQQQAGIKTISPVVERDISRIRNVSPEEVARFNPAVGAHTAVLEGEIEKLRAENRKLMEEKNLAEGQLITLQAENPDLTPQGSSTPATVRSDKQIVWPSGKAMQDVISAYLLGEAARCRGDFAQTLGTEGTLSGGRTMQTAEIACLFASGEAGYAAALLFIGAQGKAQGKIDVSTYEGPPGAMDYALQQRALLIKSLN